MMPTDSVVTLEGEALDIANELARINGRPVKAVLTELLRDRLERDREALAREARVGRIMAIGADIRAHLLEPATSADTADFYGEDGMPR